MDYDFEWDDNKNATNIQKHGIDFQDAARIWLDPRKQERFDRQHSGAEDRWQAVRAIEFGILFVVYTERYYSDGAETIRIISARLAEPYEEEAYYKFTFARMG